MIGIDPRPLTLRQLAWMYRERMRSNGEVAAWQICWIARMIGCGIIEPSAINPYRGDQVKSKELAELEAWQAKRRWQLIHTPKGK